jgi:hypothetical protein
MSRQVGTQLGAVLARTAPARVRRAARSCTVSMRRRAAITPVTPVTRVTQSQPPIVARELTRC